MGDRGPRSASFVVSAAAASLGLAACQVASSTPLIIYVTPPPTPVIIYVTPAPTPQIIYVTPAPSATPEVTAAPDMTPTPTAGPTSPAAACKGSADNRSFFAQAAKGVKFTVYCATGLPAGWAIIQGNWGDTKSGYVLEVTYEYRKTSTAFTVMEGAFCTASMCTPASSLYVGPASFGGLSAGLYSSSTGYYIFSGAVGSTHSYVLIGGMSEAAMKSYAAGMRAVPKA